MATGSTPLLGLALPVTGELSGTWGDVVNTSLTSLVDSAIAGTTTVSVDTDLTLSTTTLAANEARQFIILCTGARTAQRTITAPSQSKAYVVINATTGNYGVKIVGSGPTTGVTIANGKAALIAWKGSDFVVVASNDISQLTGTLTPANGGTGLGGATPFTNNGAVYANSTSTLTTGTLPTGAGGTGTATTPTAGGIIYAASASAYGSTAAGTAGQPLLSGGSGAPTFSTLGIGAGGTGATSLSSASSNGFIVNNVTAGQTITSANAAAALTIDNGNAVTSGTNSCLILKQGSGGASANGGQLQLVNSKVGVPTPNKFIRVHDSGAFELLNSAYTVVALTVDDTGNLIIAGATATKASGTTWSNPSDIRLKDNVRDYQKGIPELMQVRVREWEYNGKGGTSSGTYGLGVVADEVMSVLPNTVTEYSAKLNPDDEQNSDIKRFDATEITWLLVNSVKQLNEKIQKLESEIAELKSK